MATHSATESAREALRRDHQVRVVTRAEEGFAADQLPGGVYGFTSSPALASPLFAVPKYRNFEVHRLPHAVCVVGFVTAAEARQLAHPHEETVAVKLFPDAEGEATTIVSVPYDRVVHHRQYSVRNAEAVHLQIRATRTASV